jgi:thioredoxin 1
MATVNLTQEAFEKIITENSMVIIDFWASWCGPCKAFAPTFEDVSEEHPDIVFAKVNTEEQRELASHFKIRSIPTLAVFRDQILLYKEAGALPEPGLQDLISKVKELDMDEVRKQVATQGSES